MGLTAVPCTNTNTAFSLTTITLAGQTQAVFCTPLGHVLPFTRGDIGFDATLVNGADESGNNYLTYITAKYGNTTNWIQESIPRIKAFGLNTLATYNGINSKPARSAQKIPFVQFQIMSAYAQTNQSTSWGSGPVKNLISIASGTWNGYTSVGGGVADYPDPKWATLAANVLTNDQGAIEVGTSSAANKGYLLGFSYDDSDNTHCLGAGNQAATAPVGNNDFRCGYLPFFLSPLNWANSSRGVIYSDGTVYWKKKWRDNLVAKYGTIGALNAAWGGGAAFTTFDSSGTCVGTVPITCASSATEDTVGTGNGSTTSFSATLTHLPISKWSLGIFVNGVLVGGGASGAFNSAGTALYGPTISGGTVNYTTGAITVTFTTAPATSAPITARYVQNGWGIGTGLMDEDCRAGHSAYCGTGTGSDPVSLTNLPTNVKTDVNAFTQYIAGLYSSTIKSAICTWAATKSFTGCPMYLGPTVLGTWTMVPDPFVMAGFCGNADAWMYAAAQGDILQTTLDGVNAACPSQKLFVVEYKVASRDSEFQWPNSPATHASTTVTITTSTPNPFVTQFGGGALYDVNCADPTYNQLQFRPTSVTSTSFVYTKSPAPTNASTTCNIYMDDNNVGGFSSQTTRGADFQTSVVSLTAKAYTSTTFHPYVGYWSWQHFSDWSDQHPWGFVTIRDNLYTPAETSSSSVACQPPNATRNCGGELSLHSPPYGNYIAAVATANTAIDTYFTGSSAAPLVNLNPSSAAFGNSALNTPDTICNVSLNPCVIQLTNTGTATLNITSIALLTGTNFSIANNTCSSTLAASSSCNVTLTFTPIVLGALSDTLRFTTNASTSPDNVALTGLGVIPTAPAVQMSIDFLPPPVQLPAPVLSGIAPRSVYVTSAGFSQDMKTFSKSLAVTITGSNFFANTQCAFDGASLPCTCTATACTIALTWSAAMVPTAKTTHNFPILNPVVAAPAVN